MRVLLITIAIGEKYLKRYNELFRESHENYARKNNYDFKVITELLEKKYEYKEAISINKILVCDQDWSYNYDIIIYVDADILINSKSPSLHDYMNYKGKIGIVDEFNQPDKRVRMGEEAKKVGAWIKNAEEYYRENGFEIKTDKLLNTGVLVMEPREHGKMLREIFEKYVRRLKGSKRSFHIEQASIGYELQVRNMVEIIPNEFNVVWALYKYYNKDLTLDRCVRYNYFIHFAGQCDIDKVQGLGDIWKKESH